MSNIFGDIADLFSGLIGGAENIPAAAQDVSTGITGWLSSAAGHVASAIESGFLAVFKDLWDVIIGPVEVTVGIILILIAIVIAVKNDLAQVAMAFGMIAK